MHPPSGWKTKPGSFHSFSHPRVETSANQASRASSSFPDLTPLYTSTQRLLQPPSLSTHLHGRRLQSVSLIFFFFFAHLSSSVSMVSVCLPSDDLLQHLPSYLGFSYLGHGVSLHGCSSKVQPLLLTLDMGYLFTAALPDLQCGIAPLGPPAPAQPRLLGRGVGPPGHVFYKDTNPTHEVSVLLT